MADVTVRLKDGTKRTFEGGVDDRASYKCVEGWVIVTDRYVETIAYPSADVAIVETIAYPSADVAIVEQSAPRRSW